MSDEKKPTLIECVLCRKKKKWWNLFEKWNNEISEWSKVCKDCEALWELGKKTMAATKTDGKPTEARVYVEVPTDKKMGDAKGPTEVRGKDLMTALGGVSLRGTALGDPWKKPDGVERVDVTAKQDEKDSYYVSGGGHLDFKVPKARAEAMKRVIAALYNAIAKAYIDGFNDGRNLLAGLAKGEVSLDDFSEQNDNARAGRKPKRKWD